MSINTHYPLLKMNAMMAATCTNCTAVALAEQSAEFVSFRWQQPSLPPDKNDHSADHSHTAAGHFGGNSAISAGVAAFSAFCAFTASKTLFALQNK